MTMSDKRKGFFHYLFTTAIEGGINEWATVDEYQWWQQGHSGEADIDGFYAIIDSSEGDWGVEQAFIAETGKLQYITHAQDLRVDIDVINRGWYLFMDKVLASTKSEDPSQDFSNPYFRQAIVQYLTDMEDGDSDSTVADLVVQLGLFSEHVYS